MDTGPIPHGEVTPESPVVGQVLEIVRGQEFKFVSVNQLRAAIAFSIRAGLIHPAQVSKDNAREIALDIDEYWRQEDEHDRVRFGNK